MGERAATDRQCGYEASSVRGVEWSCPRERHDGGEFCLFHAPVDRKDPAAVERALLASIRGSDDRSDARFVGARFERLDLSYQSIAPTTNYPIDLRDATVEGLFSLNHATVRSPVRMAGAEVHGETDLRYANVDREVSLSCRFAGDAAFDHAQFGRHVDLTDAVFEGAASFDRAQFENGATFERTRTTGEAAGVSLSGARLPRGYVSQPPDGRTHYDLSGATLGDVEFAPLDGEEFPLQYVTLFRTDFEGFDFGQFDLLEMEFAIHGLADPPGGMGLPGEGRARGLERTYQRARMCARNSGDADVAAMFHSRTLKFRRERYRRQVAGADQVDERLRAASKWAGNAFLDLTVGFGTRPARVVTSSLALVALVAFVLPQVATVSTYGGAFGPLLLSLEAFTAVILGLPAVENETLRAILVVEAFVGGYVVLNLFGYTLTRTLE